ncbi:MAG TPA: glycosyl hydrolase family 18 protein, partial [Thermoanaerobaculia bacterium]|nr:glycosyl hydrolase family 18 protein [Thermoanaerobaculia bacterium]
MRIARILPIILFLSACRTTLPPVAPHHEYRVIGYIRGIADLSKVGARKLTHLNYSFATLNPLGVIEFENPESPAHIAQLQALKAKNPDLKVIVSVGGWEADFFSDAALDDASRCRFADSALDMVKRYALDGVDLDWEYPGQPGPGIKYRPEDKRNFTLMVKTLRDELDMLSDARGRKGFDRYTISLATAGGQRYFENIETRELAKSVDWVNVMSYDFAGEWSEVTEHHTDP